MVGSYFSHTFHRHAGCFCHPPPPPFLRSTCLRRFGWCVITLLVFAAYAAWMLVRLASRRTKGGTCEISSHPLLTCTSIASTRKPGSDYSHVHFLLLFCVVVRCNCVSGESPSRASWRPVHSRATAIISKAAPTSRFSILRSSL